MQPLLLCVHMYQARLMRLSLTALSLGITVKEVKENQWGQPLAALCGLEAERNHAPSVQVAKEMLVFAFFPESLLDRFLTEMKKSRMAPVPLKAVLTPYNRSWNCGQLCAALQTEAAQMQSRRKGAGNEAADHGF